MKTLNLKSCTLIVDFNIQANETKLVTNSSMSPQRPSVGDNDDLCIYNYTNTDSRFNSNFLSPVAQAVVITTFVATNDDWVSMRTTIGFC